MKSNFVENGESALDTNQLEFEEEATASAYDTKTIIVGNVPKAADEEVLELLFESKKRGGGGQVKSVQLNRQRRWAIVEFCEPGAVEMVMSKLPITLMGTELDLHPYTPLIQGDMPIASLDIRGLPRELTENLLTKDIEDTIGLMEASSVEYESDTEDSETNEQAGRQVVKDLRQVQLRMLKAMKYPESTTEKFPNVRVKINLEKNEIVLDGDTRAEIQSVKLNLYKTLSSISVCMFDDISTEVLEFYQSERVSMYIDKKLTENKLVCLWEVTDQSLVVCSIQADVIKCANIVRGSVKTESFQISKESAAIFWSSKWQNKIEELQKANYLLCKVVSNGEINAVLIATDDTVDGAAENVKAFLKTQSKITSEAIQLDQIDPGFAALFKINYCFSKKILAPIAKGLSQHFVSIEYTFECFNGKTSSITLKGTVEGRELAKQQIRKLFQYY